jgi:hypothetical protein
MESLLITVLEDLGKENSELRTLKSQVKFHTRDLKAL